MTSLYGINNEYIDIFRSLDKLLDPEREVEDLESQIELLNERLAINQVDYQKKIEAYMYVIREEQGFVDMIDNEIERLTKLKVSRNKKIMRLKQAVVEGMQAQRQEDLDLGVFKLRIGRSEAIQVADPKIIPQSYLREVPATWEPDKKALKKAIKEGIKIPGVALTSNFSLRVR